MTSFGGTFVKSNNPETTKKWYAKQLDFQIDECGTTFEWRNSRNPASRGFNAWSTFSNNAEYFSPSKKDFMLKFSVRNLETLLEE